VRSVDAERVAYMRKMLIEEGVTPAAAKARANIMNWTYLGFALSSGKTHPKLDDVVTELVAFALPAGGGYSLRSEERIMPASSGPGS
jgi:hypothetical protein